MKRVSFRVLLPLILFCLFAASAAAEPMCWTRIDGTGFFVDAPPSVALSPTQQARIGRIIDRNAREADVIGARIDDIDDRLDAGSTEAAALETEREAELARQDELGSATYAEIEAELTPAQRDYLRTHAIGPCLSEPAPPEPRVVVESTSTPITFVYGGWWFHHTHHVCHGYWWHGHGWVRGCRHHAVHHSPRHRHHDGRGHRDHGGRHHPDSDRDRDHRDGRDDRVDRHDGGGNGNGGRVEGDRERVDRIQRDAVKDVRPSRPRVTRESGRSITRARETAARPVPGLVAANDDRERKADRVRAKSSPKAKKLKKK
ncbi:MAG: hypothetical protein IT350_11460 [Deltaproteobacteria bacterium]|nr:hypothetical protein [Deltaproteobacteria bacterium]